MPEGILAPPFPSCPNRLAFFGSGVPRDSLLEGHLPWDFALSRLAKPGFSFVFMGMY